MKVSYSPNKFSSNNDLFGIVLKYKYWVFSDRRKFNKSGAESRKDITGHNIATVEDVVVNRGILSSERAQMRHSNTEAQTHPPIPSHAISPNFPSHNPSDMTPLTRDLLWVLLLDISLRTTLLRLADIVSLLSGKLGITVTSDTSDSSLDGASDTVGYTASEVVDLALSFLSFARSVLLLAFLLQ